MISANYQTKLKEIINQATNSRASDLHLSVGASPVIRVNQHLQILTDEIIITTEFVQSSASFLASLAGREVKAGGELYFSVTFEADVRIKVTIFYQKGLPAITIKFIPRQIMPLESLALPTSVSKFITFKHGLIIIAGPYGSGKSATIASLIQEINAQRREYIITLEKPIEYIFTSQLSIVEQREIGSDSETLALALEHLKHEDVDVVVVSDLEEAKNIRSVLEIASARALVIVSVDADSVANVMEQLITPFEHSEQVLVRSLLAEALRGILVQRLLPKIGGGVAPAVELLFSNSVVKELIKKDKLANIPSLMMTSGAEGMISLDRSLLDLVQKNVITPSDAIDASTNSEVFLRSLKR